MSKTGEAAVQTIRSKISGLIDFKERRAKFNADVFSNPEKHLICLPADKIVADQKVSQQAVERYKHRILRGEKLSPVIVVKHPRFDVYAVLDGHHRYYAYLELGRKDIECALAGDFSSVFFFMTDHGYFQPNPDAKRLKAPEIKFHDGLEKFLRSFLKDPRYQSKNKQT